MQFRAPVITGSGRGKIIGFPTINLDTAKVPDELEHGMHACKVLIDKQWKLGVMHFGSRPTFGDALSCEVHVVDETQVNVPPMIEVDVFEKLRDVKSFDSADDLIEQIRKDIERSRKIFDS